ncbi:mCG60293, partial [Mus musculus]
LRFQAPVSGKVARCSIPCRVFYWVSGASFTQPKQAVFHGPTAYHLAGIKKGSSLLFRIKLIHLETLFFTVWLLKYATFTLSKICFEPVFEV